ncbi:hypothetical protein PHYBOEH_000877 [Phytophthora boehmeriae]|uniref:Fe2OG dioxygenase domain-containing protein n=1 Tax=Phytophthora boehmeriae TaxID=109152 RepID=A0A8T1VAX6_9STRA|nr:hypothetical protein PHYBOEH_000877 [Phytophthora boehmeriae]
MKGSDNEDNGNYDGDSDDFEDTWPFGGEGEADDVPMPKGTSCLQINKALARTEKIAGEFTFGGPADSLPATSGLFVKEFGPVPLPLHEDVANKLIAVCEKSPFGRKKETLVDDKVRKSWQLDASQVELKNPLWEDGLAKLSSTIAERLGYKDVPLQCKLYKMLVYAEGGHFAKHKDTEKEDGMIATLVVQPPSLHEGGDLVVHRDTSTQYRHDFGEADGTAAYVPHYAVHYADAEHSLEEVTKGYRLVLVYSICLPLTMHLSPRGFDKELLEELTNAINKMKTGDDSFALLLSHQYTAKSIEDLGSGAFKGVDRARFHALQEANAGASPDKKVHLFIAKLAHKIHLYDEAMGDGSWKKDEELLSKGVSEMRRLQGIQRIQDLR